MRGACVETDVKGIRWGMCHGTIGKLPSRPSKAVLARVYTRAWHGVRRWPSVDPAIQSSDGPCSYGLYSYGRVWTSDPEQRDQDDGGPDEQRLGRPRGTRHQEARPHLRSRHVLRHVFRHVYRHVFRHVPWNQEARAYTRTLGGPAAGFWPMSKHKHRSKHKSKHMSKHKSKTHV